MLGPSYRIADRSGFLRTGCRAEYVGYVQENFFGHPAIALDHFRRISPEVPLQYLEHAERIFERHVPLKVCYLLSLASAVLAMTAAQICVPGRSPGVFFRGAFIGPGLWIIFFLL